MVKYFSNALTKKYYKYKKYINFHAKKRGS